MNDRNKSQKFPHNASYKVLRLAKEDKNLRAGRFPAVLPIVFYTGDAPWNVPPDTLGMFEAALRERLLLYLPKQHYVLIDLCRLDAGRNCGPV